MDGFAAFIESILTSQITTVAILFLLLTAFMREWLVAGRRHRRDLDLADQRYQEMREDRDQWRSLALSGTDLLESAVEQQARKP